MPNTYTITTDYRTNATWELRDPDLNSVKIAAVGTLAERGSYVGYQLRIQKDAMVNLLDEVESVRDAIGVLSNPGFDTMRINGVKIRPPESVDIPDLIGKSISSLGLTDVDRLVGLANWIKTNFASWIGTSSPLLDFNDVKVTYRKEGSNTDSWIALKDIYPLPVVPPGGVPRAPDGTVQLEKPFSVENDTAVYMMVAGSSGRPEQVKIRSIEEMFFLDTVLATFGSSSDYFSQLAKARTDTLVAKLPESARSTAPFDAVAFRAVSPPDLSFNSFAALPVIDTTLVIQTAGSSFGPIQAPKGSLIRSPISSGASEYKYYYANSDNPSKSADLVEVMIDMNKKVILSLSDEERQTVISQFGDTVISLTQRSSQQSVYLNELMQKLALFFDSASNALKAMTESENRVASGI